MENEASAYDKLYLQDSDETDWSEEPDWRDDSETLVDPQSDTGQELKNKYGKRKDDNQVKIRKNHTEWIKELIAIEKNPVTLIEKIMATLITFNRQNANLSTATRFSVGWLPKFISEVVLWTEQLICKIIIIEADVTIDKGGMVMIKGLMIRRPETTIVNHVKLAVHGHFILVKMKNYGNYEDNHEKVFLM